MPRRGVLAAACSLAAIACQARDPHVIGAVPDAANSSALDAGGEDAIAAVDATDPVRQDASEFGDAGFAADALELDAGEVVDAGFAADAQPFADATAPIDGGIPEADAGAPPADAGAVIADAGFGGWDAGFGGWDAGWGWDGSFPGWDAGGPAQTVVTLVPGTVAVWLNLMPAVPPDPLHFSADLAFDNPGPGAETIAVTVAQVSVFPPAPFFQSFAVQPVHTAPVGMSTTTVTKVGGSATPPVIVNPSSACGLQGFVVLQLSNGQTLREPATITCVH